MISASKLCAVALLASLLSACGGNSNSQQLTYQFSENGCDTQEHSFSSLTDYCAALESDSTNGSCALDLRETQFAQGCPGTFTETP
jgi:hypothetical protein